MKSLFWADGSAQIGLGHLARASMIARALNAFADINCILLTCSTDEALGARFRSAFQSVQRISSRADASQEINLLKRIIAPERSQLLVMDKPHYDSSLCDMLAQLRRTPNAPRIAAFDAAGIRPGCVDVIIDANCPAEDARRFDRTDTRALFGPDFAVVNAAFLEARDRFCVRDDMARIAVSMGGSDPNSVSAMALQAALEVENATIDIVIGPAFEARTVSRLFAAIIEGRVNIHRDVNHESLAAIFADADACIISGGITMFEVATIGVPGFVIAQNDPQLNNARHLSSYEAVVNLGLFSDTSVQSIAAALSTFGNSPIKRKKLSKAATEAVDGKGIDRICRALLGLMKGTGNTAQQ